MTDNSTRDIKASLATQPVNPTSDEECPLIQAEEPTQSSERTLSTRLKVALAFTASIFCLGLGAGIAYAVSLHTSDTSKNNLK